MIGELAALCAAMSYATSSNIYSHAVKACTPIQLNYLRSIVSIAFMGLVLLFTSDSIFPDDTLRNYMLLIISGMIGIGIGDCFYFKALSILGARKTILLETMAPPFTGVISFFYYGETLSVWGWLGIFVTAYGIHMVVNEQAENKKEVKEDIELQVDYLSAHFVEPESTPTPVENSKEIIPATQVDYRTEIIGICCGVAFTACQALGMVLSHDAARSKQFSSLQSSLLRIIAGMVCCIVIIYFKKDESYRWAFDDKRKNQLFFLGTFLGPIFGIWSQQTSLNYTKPEIAQTILATTPIFGLIISWLSGEQMKVKYIIGSLIAILGVVIIIWL